MLFEDKESNILEDFRMLAEWSSQSVFLVHDTSAVRSMLQFITDDVIWKKEWIDSSSKSAPPPDFFNDNKKLMMEVMRVDDHSFERNGKIKNPTNQRAREIEKELKNKGLLEGFLNAQLIVNAVTDLPTLEDHNYTYYKQNFKRVVEKHKHQIDHYKANHPGFQLVFFVFDESSMYCRVSTSNKTVKKGELFKGVPHLWFYDKAFLDGIIHSGVDFLVWYTPYKYIEHIEPPLELPQACVFDCNQMVDNLVEYPEANMMSVEE